MARNMPILFVGKWYKLIILRLNKFNMQQVKPHASGQQNQSRT